MRLHRALPAILITLAAAPASAQPGAITIDTDWVFDATAAHPGGSIRAALQVKLPGKYHVQSNKPADEYLIPTILTVTPPEGLTVGEVVYPAPVTFEVLGFDEPLAVFDQTFVIGVAIEVGPDVRPGRYTISSSLGYQACDDKVCLMPTSVELSADLEVVPASAQITTIDSPLFEEIEFTGETRVDVAPVRPPPITATPDHDCDVMAELGAFDILGTAGGYLGSDDFIEFIDGAETGTLKRDFFEGKGPLAILVLIIVGGVLLNLTPCVLPLIPINLAIIGAGAQAGSRARGFALGGTYGLAMAAVYGGLGLIVILTASTFGVINSTIWFNVAIAVLFVFLALAMFDVIAIDFTKYQGKLDLAGKAGGAGRGTFALAFGMGGVTALLAGACVAPVVIHVIVYSSDQYAKGVTIALALPFFLGLGMAVPWPFAGAGLSFLPKPGKWMVRVKQGMGLLILAFAAYYAYIAWGIYQSKRVDPAAVTSAVQEHLEGGWTASICDGLATARAENKPVLIDMWATWCKNCLAMDKSTFKDDLVVERLADYVKIKFQAEDLGASPNREMLELFEGIGLPTYAILRPRTGATDSD
ncbi:MAG: cytochrome c biogenesis protein CcdA [Planctomycetota bacterium]|jgi:cytochrome c biogenesis protein CcdA